MHEGSGSDDAKGRDVGFLTVKYFERRLHLDRLVRSPVREVHSRRKQPPSHGRFKVAVCEHAPNHGAQSPSHAFGHTDLLRRIGSGEYLDNTDLQAVLSKLLPGVLAALVGTPTNESATDWNDRRADEQLKRLKSLRFVDE